MRSLEIGSNPTQVLLFLLAILLVILQMYIKNEFIVNSNKEKKGDKMNKTEKILTYTADIFVGIEISYLASVVPLT